MSAHAPSGLDSAAGHDSAARHDAAPELAELRVLVVDDEQDIRGGLAKLVRSLGAEVALAADGVEALEHVLGAGADLVLTDLQMPRMTGAELLAEVKRHAPSTEVVVLTGYGTVQGAVACLQAGAAHFMTKPFDNRDVLDLVGRLGRQLLAQRAELHGPADGARSIVAEDPAMRRVLELVERVAPSPVPVLISGDSGTGKEVVARALHARSPAHDRRFLAVNAAALPDTLLESELFGHRRGAFTGADRDRAGLFEQAAGGTVFLDELSSMSPSFQGKLLRVLEQKVVRPLGSAAEVPVEFRLIAATNRDLDEMIAAGEFREDLYYRLSVTSVRLPRLAERPRDLEPLALRFLSQAARTCLGPGARVPELSQEALDALRAHSWPGNVRELENAITRALVVCAGDRILPHHLGLDERAGRGGPDGTGRGPSAAGTSPEARDPLVYAEGKRQAVESFQRQFVQRALERSGGNVSQAAERCGLTRAALQRILRQLEIEPAQFRAR